MALPINYLQILGAAMYPTVHAAYPGLAMKLTDMILELPFANIIQLIGNEEKLGAKIDEVKRAYDARPMDDGQTKVKKWKETLHMDSLWPNTPAAKPVDPRSQAIAKAIASIITGCKNSIPRINTRHETFKADVQADSHRQLQSLEHRRARLQARLKTLGDVVTMIQAAAPEIYDATYKVLWLDVAGIREDVSELKNEVKEVKEREKVALEEAEKRCKVDKDGWEKTGQIVIGLANILGFRTNKP
ncbi:uncharacterized protein K460DRAFT_409623 [Cucurbitaria berberidis CBS 394.84]|uniref:PABC domain-containing protein n=1 Tax=Cucurbitaria berberidis CBS 394.84 TaxID=1168544 RepID=A0A9P4GAV2_9PLEO|nr:uncharacterized protein K460DRAFT_409623 [Cucurbitaria berberidis CBS 394.84]KAF1842205.1 hypothetical protein K460DRAFT_409623 [Cucurbitaria berberidis CBS 394.84]